MTANKSTLYEKIDAYCKELELEVDLIPKERKAKLLSLSHYISQKIEDKQTLKLVVICTHNSRRSHMGQIWLAVAADILQLKDFQTFSGGTEATAFNIRAVKAMQRIGFEITVTEEQTENPVYQVSWKEGMQPYPAFSKKYSDKPNPREDFAAIMVCSEADTACPFVSGCDYRLSLPYDDPKEFDGTELEEKKYGERVRQIGREMLFTLNQIRRLKKNERSN